MINKKILIIAPYPIVKPRHGGQKRVKATVDLYKSFAKQVKFVAIFHQASYPDYDVTDIALGQKENLDLIDTKPYEMDQIVGRSIDNDANVRSQFAEVLKTYQPDIIEVEQAFLYEGLKILLDELNLCPLLIFSSQNIEYKLKKKIYKDLSIDVVEAKRIVAETKKIEEAFSRDADLVIAVSQEDADEHTNMGAKKVIVAHNGIEKSKASEATLRQWRAFKQEHGIEKIISFIGSGHPPNYLGYLDVVGSTSDFLPDSAAIVMAGGVSEYFKATYGYKSTHRTQEDPIWERVIPVGFLEEDELSALLECSDIILLPITSGGGSNLKTAEALLSGKKVVATTYAFRGYEPYLKLPNVYIADTGSNYKKAIIAALASPVHVRSNAERHLVAKVQWVYTLRPIKQAVVRLSMRQSFQKTVRKAHGVSRRVASRIKRTIIS